MRLFPLLGFGAVALMSAAAFGGFSDSGASNGAASAAAIAAERAAGRVDGQVADARAADLQAAARQGLEAVEDVADARQKSGFAGPGDTSDVQARRIAYLLNDAVDRLSDGRARNLRERFLELVEARRDAGDQLEEARFAAVSGAEPGFVDSVIGLVRPTGPAQVAAMEKRIAEIDGEMAAVKDALKQSLAEIGVAISEDQLDGLLAMATADSFIDMMAAYANLRAIDEILKVATESSGESLAAARRYYGLHATLTEIAAWMQSKFVADIDGKFLPELDAIEAEARGLREEAVRLMARNPESAAALEANLAAQDLTLKTAGLYRRELEKQRSAMQAALDKTRRQSAVAINTWRTVKVSSDLVLAMRASDDGFQALLALEVPDLRPFQGVEIRAEFERISGRLLVAASDRP